MNLNNNPTSTELRALLDACEDGAGVQVLWVERLGEVQVALMLAETQADWLKGMNGNVLFQYEANTKSDRAKSGSAVDELYVATLFERLLRDWNTQDDRMPIVQAEYKAGLVVLRLRARENKYWFEALILANFQMESQLKALLKLEGTSGMKSGEVKKLAYRTFCSQMISYELYERISSFDIRRNAGVYDVLTANRAYDELEPIVTASDELIHELNQIPLAA